MKLQERLEIEANGWNFECSYFWKKYGKGVLYSLAQFHLHSILAKLRKYPNFDIGE